MGMASGPCSHHPDRRGPYLVVAVSGRFLFMKSVLCCFQGGDRNTWETFHEPRPFSSAVCHAELNAIMNKNSADVKGCSMYVALFPCNECAKLIIQAGRSQAFPVCPICMGSLLVRSPAQVRFDLPLLLFRSKLIVLSTLQAISRV